MIVDLQGGDHPDGNIQSEICIVGGGIAGLLAAQTLADAGRRVVVLESGGRRVDPAIHELNGVTQSATEYQTALTGRVRALGGTSTAWGGRLIPQTAHDLAARDHLGLPGWPLPRHGLDRFLQPVERLFRLDHSAYDGDGSPAVPHEARLPSDHGDLQARWPKWPLFRRRNVAKLLRSRIEGRPNPEIWLNATVCDFVLDRGSGRLAGVQAAAINSRRICISADQFIFAAGALETTRLLLLVDHLAGGQAFAQCEVLGGYFHDHLAVEVGRIRPVDARRTNLVFGYRIGGQTRRSLHLETTPQAQREDGAASGFVTVQPEYPDGSLHHYVRTLGASVQAGRWRDVVPSRGVMRDMRSVVPTGVWRARYGQMYLGDMALRVDARIEQVPSSASRLTLSHPRDRFDVPLLDIGWRKTPADLVTLRSVLKRARRFWDSTFLGASSPVAWDNQPERLLEQARDTRHPAGSARMGTNPRTSVVGPDLRCHAVPNLYVASAAVFPSSGSANPTLTVMQLALLTAESVLRKDAAPSR